MARQADEILNHDPGDAARARLRQQYNSLWTSAGWLLGVAEPYAALIPSPDATMALRLRRAARTLGWSGAEQERLGRFAELYAAREEEAEALLADEATAPDALAPAAVRIERAAAEALSVYVGLQSEAARAQELSRTSEAEEDKPSRLGARAEIGAGVRARLAEIGAERLPAMGLELYCMRGFLDDAHCDGLIALVERDLFPSGILGDRANEGFRTSKSCNLPATEPLVDSFENKVCDLLGINRRFSESVQGQRYEVGQEFKAHHDFFHKGETYYADVAGVGGQRTWTAMQFLNEPEAGGCTGFPRAGAKVKPQAGALLVWNNMQADGKANHFSLHHGMPVEAGRKYVLTKWFRERPLVY